MRKVTQVAFQLDDASLAELDRLAAGRSRAAVLRAAVQDYLVRRRQEEIDEALARGYAAQPQGPDERGMAAASRRGLALSDLDW